MPKAFSTLGLDGSLNHGVLAIAHWVWVDVSKGYRLSDYDVVFKWNKKGPHLGKESSVDDIKHLVLAMEESLEGIKPGTPVALDFDFTTAFWGRNGAQWSNTKITMRLAFFTGYVSRMLEAHGLPTVVFTPAEVRSCLGLGARADKEEIWRTVGLAGMLSVSRRHQVKRNKQEREDLRDALILSYLMSVGRKRQAA